MGWINVGIAGHRDLELVGSCPAGRTRWSMRASGRTPGIHPLALDPPCPSRCGADGSRRSSATFDADEALYEMEAAGFYPSATAACERRSWCRCMKIVSDNRAARRRSSLTSAIGGASWSKAAVPVLLALIDSTERLSCRGAPPPSSRGAKHRRRRFDDYLGRWHFTVTQTRQLERLVAPVWRRSAWPSLRLAELRLPAPGPRREVLDAASEAVI